MAFNPFRRIQHHHGGINGGQGAIGVFRKILVAWRVQQVEHHAVTFKSHDGGRNRNPAILFNLHPVGTRAPRIALGAHRAGKLNGAALEQQFFGQRGFAGIWMGDDGKAPPAGGFFGDAGGGNGGFRHGGVGVSIRRGCCRAGHRPRQVLRLSACP